MIGTKVKNMDDKQARVKYYRELAAMAQARLASHLGRRRGTEWEKDEMLEDMPEREPDPADETLKTANQWDALNESGTK